MDRLKLVKNILIELQNSVKKQQKTICFDFDGVIASYDRWKGVDVFGEPNEEIIQVIRTLKNQGIKIIIFTTRLATPKLVEYLKINGVLYDEINKNSDNPKDSSCKPIANAYVDDRAINYNGQSKDTLLSIINVFLNKKYKR